MFLASVAILSCTFWLVAAADGYSFTFEEARHHFCYIYSAYYGVNLLLCALLAGISWRRLNMKLSPFLSVLVLAACSPDPAPTTMAATKADKTLSLKEMQASLQSLDNSLMANIAKKSMLNTSNEHIKVQLQLAREMHDEIKLLEESVATAVSKPHSE
jgi:hypothetical protein